MTISLSKIINDWIPDNSKVIDFGCGDGSLLKEFIDTKKIQGYGIEIDHKKIQECIEKGVPVIQQDIDEGIQEFESSDFDISIMASSIQCLKSPHVALRRMLKRSNKCVVTLPNLGYWRCRVDLVSGKMPVTPNLPSSWYETDNLHLCTINDFEKLCLSEGFVINKKIFLSPDRAQGFLASYFPNLFATEGVYLIGRE